MYKVGEVACANGGINMRDYFAAHAPTTMQDAINMMSMLGEKDPMRCGGDLLRTMAQMRYAYADAMLAEGASEHDAQDDHDTLSDLQAYFPKAETLHDCYLCIEALEAERDMLLSALEDLVSRCDNTPTADGSHISTLSAHASINIAKGGAK